MKYRILMASLGVVLALVMVLGGVSVVEAQAGKPPVADGYARGKACYGGGCSYGGMMGGWQGMGGFSLVDATAEATGLTTEEVIAALQAGQTYAEIAEAQGVELQAIVDAFLAVREEALAAAVADGRITQEQADEMLEHMAEEVAEHLEASWVGYGGCGGTGGGMWRGGFGRRVQPGEGSTTPFSPRW